MEYIICRKCGHQEAKATAQVVEIGSVKPKAERKTRVLRGVHIKPNVNMVEALANMEANSATSIHKSQYNLRTPFAMWLSRYVKHPASPLYGRKYKTRTKHGYYGVVRIA